MEICNNTIELNNKATSLLAQGKISHPNLMFRQALQNLKQFPKDEETNQQPQFSKRVRRDGVPSSSEESDEVMICSVTISKEFYDQEAAERTGSAMGVLSVYNRAFSIAPTSSSSCDFTITQLASYRKIGNRMSAVVFYNMGLLCHCRGIQNGKSQDLHDAMALYEWSYKILIQLIGEKPVDVVIDTLLLLALFNNVGHIHSRAFSIAPTSSACDSTKRQLASCRKRRNRMSAVVFYNMGLLRHCRGIQNGKSQDLSDAMVLYERSYKILIHLIEQKPDNIFIDRHLLLALFNNMGHIHSLEFETAAAKRCVANMKRFMVGPNSVKEDDILFFQRNVRTAPANLILTAPAA